MDDQVIRTAIRDANHLTIDELRRCVTVSGGASSSAVPQEPWLREQVQSRLRFAATVSLAVQAFNEQLHANKSFDDALHRACEEYGIAQYADDVWHAWKCQAELMLRA